MTENFVATSIARRLITRMQATHDRRRISVFAGPPGIGKTTAIDAFRERNSDCVAVVKIARRNAKEVLVLQHVVEAVRRLYMSSAHHAASSIWDLRSDLFGAICQWAGVDTTAARNGEYEPNAFGRLTIVIDEAQNLSREAIDALRYWNDQDRCYAPFPVGLVFVGNNEFSLGADQIGASVISAAVADRALYIQSLNYDELTDDDIGLFIDAKGLTDPGAASAILRCFRGPRAIRSLRRVNDLVDDLVDLAGSGIVTAETVRAALNYV